MATDIDYLGQMPLFVGVESQYWQLAQFQNAASRAKALGISSLLIKVGEAGSLWYGSIGGWQKVLSTIAAVGVKAVPYYYSDGGGVLASEIAALTTVMKAAGIVIADMEIQYNDDAHDDQVHWAQQVNAALLPVPGIFGVCTWGDPAEQNWQHVMAALAPCTNFWMPQVYSDYLASVYKTQYAGYSPVYPAFDLAGDFGPNNIVANVRAAQSPIIALWEYQELASVAATLSTALQFGGGITTMPKPTTPNQYQITAAITEWESTAALFPGSQSPSYTTGIAKAWQERYFRGQQLGGPTSGELGTIDWGGKSITRQNFRYGRAEWNNGSCRFFDGRGEIL